MNRVYSIFFMASTVFLDVEAQNIQVNAQFDSTMIMIGDQIKLHVEMERQKGINAAFPVWTDTLTRSIEVIETYPIDSVALASGMMRFTQDVLVTSFDSGQHVVPPIRFPYVANGKHDTVFTRPLYLDVHTLPIDTARNIADIKPIYHVPINWLDKWLIPFCIWLLRISAGLIAAGIYIFRRRRRKEKPIYFPPVPPKPPHVVALAELNRLRSEKLWQNNRTKEYYTRLSDTVRTYIEGRFGILAMEMTRDEILTGLQRIGFEDNNLVNRLKHLLSLADMVKFAKAVPMPDENETSMLDSYLFVNNTKAEDAPAIEKTDDDGIILPDGETSIKYQKP